MPRDSSTKAVPLTIHLSGPQGRTITTDAEGEYDIRNLEPGDYTVAAEVPDGFGTQRPLNIRLADRACGEVDWPVTIEGRIRGRVVDADGRPVADLQMQLERRTGREQPGPYVVTDLDGTYAFEHLPPDDYLVSARNAGYLTDEGASTIYYPHSQRSDAQLISVAQAATVDGIDFVLARLRPTPYVTVSVALPNLSPAPAGLYVHAYQTAPAGTNHHAQA